MSSFENIPYLWGGTDPSLGLDCFTLASYAQTQHGRSPLPDHDWVYQIFDDKTFPPQMMMELLTDCYGAGVLRSPKHLDLIAIQAETVVLGTMIDDGVLHFGSNLLSVVTPYKVLIRRFRVLGVWEP